MTRRNDLAHRSSSSIDWSQLDADIKAIEIELLNMNIISSSNDKFEYFGERNPIDNHDDPNVAFAFEYIIGVKQNGNVAAEIKWRENIMNE